MPVHKFSEAFFKDMQVEWPCPACGQKSLEIIKSSFVVLRSSDSRKMSREEWFDIDMDLSVFSCMALCSREQCGEAVACSGKSGWEQDWNERMNMDEYYQYHKPIHFFPPLHPFELPDKCPDEISEPLKASFSIFLAQPSAAANLIRISVEMMLTAMGVPEQYDNGKPISLHRRLGMLPEPYTVFSPYLMAIKVFGNEGSHTYDTIHVSDIEEAFEIMEYVVHNLFSGRKETIEVMAKKLSDKFTKK